MTSTRVITAASLAAMVGLIVAVSVNLNGSSPPRVDPAHLRVGPGVPSTATARITYSSSVGTSVTISAALSGPEDAVGATAQASNGLVEGSLQARAVAGTLYVDVAQFTSQLGAPWASVHVPRELGGIHLALAELRHPDLALLRALGATTTPTATGRVTVVHVNDVRMPQLGSLPLGLPLRGNATFTITTGSAGQVLSVAARIVGVHSGIHVDAKVIITGYDQPVHVAAPKAADVAPLRRADASRLFGSDTRAFLRLLDDLGSHLTLPPPPNGG